MRIISWNIGSKLTTKKIQRVKAMDFTNLDIVCLSEGSKSEENCSKLEEVFAAKGFDVYYSPRFPKLKKELNLEYPFYSWGLKIFVKKGTNGVGTFSFTEQRFKGRIVNLQFNWKGLNYLLFFVHLPSKYTSDYRRAEHITELSMFIGSKLRGKPASNVVVMGDFNTEPWGESIRESKYINSFFHVKEFEFELARNKFDGIYFNPYFEHIQSNPNKDLIGTFYSKNHIGLVDFALLSKEIKDYKVKVILSINGVELLKRSRNEVLIVDGFDHLPIEMKLN